MTNENDNSQIEFEAAAFRRLVQHLRERHDVQNIDLMNLAGFCRNCLSTGIGRQPRKLAFRSARINPGNRLRHAL